MNEISTFTLIALLLVVSPGPNGVLILKTVSAHGKQQGVLNILGLTSATFIHGALSIFGLSALILHSAELFLVVKIMGAAYLFYIGAKTIIASFKMVKPVSLVNSSVAINPASKGAAYFYSEGFLTQILNPKVSMFYLAAFPQFITFGEASYLDAFTLVAIHATIIFFWFLGVTQLVDKIKILSKESRIGRWVQGASGALLVYFGGLLLSQEVSK
jgi:threonine/homoserine/homoserine lactone efflux protein